MMTRLVAAAAVAVAALVAPIPAAAQTTAIVVSSCGGASYSAGQNRQVTQDTAGQLCGASTTSGGTVTANQGTPNAGGSANSWPVQGAVANAGTNAGSPVKVGGVYNSTFPTYTDGQIGDGQLDSRGNLKSAICGTPGPTCANMQSAGSDAVSNATNVSGPIMYSRGAMYNGSTWDRTRSIQGADGTGLGVIATAQSPNSNANAGVVAVVSSALEACHVLKSGAGNLYSLGVTIQATTGIVQVFNATAAPSDGAVTPVWSQPVLSNGTLGGATWNWNIPLYLSTGITVCFSSATTPFTKTASATAMFTGAVK